MSSIVHCPPSDQNLFFIGRWDTSRPLCFVSHFGGAYFRTAFTGVRVTLRLAKPATLLVEVDGMPDVLFRDVAGNVEVTPTGLRDGMHQLRVAARHENDEIALEGLVLHDGAILRPSASRERLIEFIGDSITLGGKTRLGITQSFSWLAAESLQAEHTHIAYSGIALVDGFRYDYAGAPQDGMEKRYFLDVQPNSSTPAKPWGFPPPHPNTIVINLGSNDGMLKVPPALFEERYISFLARLRAVHPSSCIIAMRPFLGYMENEVRAAVRRTGDAKIRYVDTAGWISKAETFDGDHPTEEGHRKAALKLVEVLRTS
jgi:lysophospholipase L1-like esterase